METFLSTQQEYLSFLIDLSVVARYIEYEFIIELEHDTPNLFDVNILNKLKSNNDNDIETQLLKLIFDNRISLGMISADIANDLHRVKKIRVLSVLDDNIMEGLKEYENFYTIDQEYMSDDYRKLLEEITRVQITPELQDVINNKYFGDVTISFYDEEKKKIIDIYCHEGSYNISENYDSLLTY